MNREFKFRFWDSTEKRFINLCRIDENGKVREGNDYYEDIVIQQYTGLKDKNGKEIYEGDILEIWDGRKLPVEFGEYFTGFERRDSHNGWYIASPEAISDLALDERYAVDEYGVSVIGNIYETPELL